METTPDLAVNAPPNQEEAERNRKGMIVAVNCLFIAILGNLMFYDQWLGINIGLYTMILVVVGTALLVGFETPIFLKHVAFGLPAVLFAFYLGVHSADVLVVLNLGIAAGSLFVFIRFAQIERFLGGSLVYSILAQIEAYMVGWIEGPIAVLNYALSYFNNVEVKSGDMVRAKAVMRGLALALPILVVFGLLLGSADVVFGDLLEGLFGWLEPDADLVFQIIVIGLFTWVNLALLRLLIFGPPFLANTPRNPNLNLHVPKLGMIEASILLGSVNMLFLVFVLMQARYLFGGEANITAQGYTYAEYARRGFGEMLVVSIMTTGLIGLLEFSTFRTPQQEKLFRFLTAVLIGLTGVILVAAWRRLVLYEDAYGFTRLRVMSGIFMGWLGILLAIVLADVLLKRKLALLGIGLIICSIGYVGTLNLINLDRYIASHNVERFHDTGKIDVEYLLFLSDDAIPAYAGLIDDTALKEADRATLMAGLAHRLEMLDTDHIKRKGVDYHWGKDRAWQALDDYRADLTPYFGRWGEPAWE